MALLHSLVVLTTNDQHLQYNTHGYLGNHYSKRGVH